MPAATTEPMALTTAERAFEKSIDKMSPFEAKNILLKLARDEDKKSDRTLLDAGRGNPNWVCTTPRSAFYLLGQWSEEECELTMNQPDFHLAGMPRKEGSAARLRGFIAQHQDAKGAAFLAQAFDYATGTLGLDPDTLAMEWAEGMAGCEYPVPERVLACTSAILGAYLTQEMCGGTALAGGMELFPTEGGTAAMCYLFYCLKCNHLVNPGDKIALMTPIFTPYLEIPQLPDYDLEVVHVNASTKNADGLHTWQYPDEELEKLADPAVKLLCLVNPSNPASFGMDEHAHQELVRIVREKNPNLLIITDDVYGTFVPGFRSVFADLPQNTALVYSFSKYFGATGWRVAAIAVGEDNKFDELIAQQSDDVKAQMATRYASLTDDVPSIKFIDRMVADSRLVALNGTAGLSTPQQVLISLFSLHGLLDVDETYKRKMQETIRDRLTDLWRELGWELPADPLRAGYYSIIDLGLWAKRLYGDDFVTWLKGHYSSLDVVVRLARDTGIVLMDGHGFDAPEWSVRVSLANLQESDYLTIGKHVSALLAEYAEAWKADQGK